MDRTAVFVDAGYLFASGSKLVANEGLPRGELQLDKDAICKLLERLAMELSGLPLLRIYWYDGATSGPSPEQVAMAYRPHVKLRLGFLNPQGQQLGVDSLIVTDLINLARNRAMTDAVLLSGDEDLRIGVQQAQEFGVRVHLLGIAPTRDNQASALVQEADTVRELGLADVQTFLSRAAAGSVISPTLVAKGATIEQVAKSMAKGLEDELIRTIVRDSVGGSLPPQIDRQLLLAGTQAVGGATLTAEQKRGMRMAFLEECRALLAS
jgi:hypothetical protein